MNILLKGLLYVIGISLERRQDCTCTNTLFLPIAIGRGGQVFDRKSGVSPLL